MMEMAAKAASPAEASRDFVAEGFFEYHLYTLDGRTTIKDSQTKQLTLLAATDVPVQKELIYYGAAGVLPEQLRRADLEPEGRGATCELKNSKENRLGLPAPQGQGPRLQGRRVGQPAVHRRGLDRPHAQGRAREDQARATPSTWWASARRRTGGRSPSNLYEVEWEIALRNHKTEAQTVTVIEPVPGDWQVLQSSHPYEKVEAHTLRYEIAVPKEGAAKVTYRVRLRF